MKLRDLIAELQEKLEQNGNLDVIMTWQTTDSFDTVVKLPIDYVDISENNGAKEVEIS